MSNHVSRKILSIDGGGLKGVFPAAFLAHVEATTKKRVVDHFDLIVGTSTGGIIALGLGLGLSAAEILTFYTEKGPEIFAQSNGKPEGFWGATKNRLAASGRNMRHAWTTKYGSETLESALYEVFRDRRLGESLTRLVIPAYNSTTQQPYVFKTSHHQRLTTDYLFRVVDVAMATAAAPTYFKSHNFAGGLSIIDGGIWANNPAGIAAVEGAAMLQWDMQQAKMLSLGCSEQFIEPRHKVGGVAALCGGWVADILFRGQDRGSMGTAKMLMGHPHENPCLFRISPTLGKKFKSLDNASFIPEIRSIAVDQARHYMPEIEKYFLDQAREAFVPCRKLE